MLDSTTAEKVYNPEKYQTMCTESINIKFQMVRTIIRRQCDLFLWVNFFSFSFIFLYCIILYINYIAWYYILTHNLIGGSLFRKLYHN